VSRLFWAQLSKLTCRIKGPKTSSSMPQAIGINRRKSVIPRPTRSDRRSCPCGAPSPIKGRRPSSKPIAERHPRNSKSRGSNSLLLLYSQCFFLPRLWVLSATKSCPASSTVGDCCRQILETAYEVQSSDPRCTWSP
jgi:hypothetical protein